MISLKRIKKRSYQRPWEKYLPYGVAGALALMLILAIAGFSGRGRMAARLNESREVMAASVQSDVHQAMNAYGAISRRNADLTGDALPNLKQYMYSANAMNRVLTQTFGAEYSMIDADLYARFQEAMAELEKRMATGQSTEEARQALATCVEEMQADLDNRFSAEGNLLPRVAAKPGE